MNDSQLCCLGRQMLSFFFVPLPLQPETFPYKEDMMSANHMCLVFAVLLFIGGILSFKVTSDAIQTHWPPRFASCRRWVGTESQCGLCILDGVGVILAPLTATNQSVPLKKMASFLRGRRTIFLFLTLTLWRGNWTGSQARHAAPSFHTQTQ